MITQIDKNVFRGPRPDNMDDLKARGVQTIINLETGWFEWFHGESGQEKERAEKAGINYFHIPIDDILFPCKEKMDDIVWFLEQDKVTYVHCRHGNDRTGIVCAAYRVKVQHWSVDQAIAEVYSMGFHKFPYEFPLGWEKSLRRYLA